MSLSLLPHKMTADFLWQILRLYIKNNRLAKTEILGFDTSYLGTCFRGPSCLPGSDAPILTDNNVIRCDNLDIVYRNPACSRFIHVTSWGHKTSNYFAIGHCHSTLLSTSETIRREQRLPACFCEAPISDYPHFSGEVWNALWVCLANNRSKLHVLSRGLKEERAREVPKLSRLLA